MADITLPRSNQALINLGDGGVKGTAGTATREFYNWMRQVANYTGDTGLQEQIDSILKTIEDIQNDQNFKIQGNYSVRVTGTQQGGVFSLYLEGDALLPSNTSYYGTDSVGTKGWYLLGDAFSTATLEKTVDSTTGVVSFDLADLADTGVGAALVKITRDTYGRVEGTQSATTDDLTEGATNLYFTAARVLATVLAGLSTATNAVITAADTVLSALGKLQAQITGIDSTVTGLVVNTITDGDTTHAPSGDAVFDALALKQPLDATLTALAGQNWAQNALPIGSGADTVSQTSFAANTFPARASTGNLVAKTITDFGLSLVDDSNAAAALTTLGIPTLASGTYTPTTTLGANAAVATASQFQWMRIGNAVTVSGRVDVSCTAAGSTQTIVGLSLPIPSNFSSSSNLAGSGAMAYNPYVVCLVLADATNDRANLAFYCPSTPSVAGWFTFTYLVI